MFSCEICGKILPQSEMTVFEGQYFCHNCLEKETVICHCCGERIWRDDALGDSMTPLCETCEEYHYSHCADCGRLVKVDALRYPSGDAPGYCEECSINHVEKLGGNQNVCKC